MSDDPIADDAPPPEPVLEPSKVTRAQVTPSGTTPRRRTKAEADKPSASAEPATTAESAGPAQTADGTDSTPVRHEHFEEPSPDDGDTVQARTISISQGGIENASAETIEVRQGGIGNATADAIDVRQGGIGRANAKDIAVTAGGIGFASGERVSVEMGGIGAVYAPGEARLTQGGAGYVIGQNVTVDQSLVSTLVADKVTIRQPSAVLVLIARQVDGTVRPLLDWRGAIVAGAVAGVLIGLIRRGRR